MPADTTVGVTLRSPVAAGGERDAGASQGVNGRYTVKVEPSPKRLRTVMRPSIMLASDCDISSPSPVPPNLRATPLSTW